MARRTHGEANNVAEVIEASVPGISRRKLLAWRHVQDQVAQ